MTDNRPISAEQARLAVEAAGLDPSRPLTEQLEPGAAAMNEDRLRARIAEEIAEALGRAEHPETGGPRTAEAAGRNLLNAIERSRTSRFVNLGEEEPDAA